MDTHSEFCFDSEKRVYSKRWSEFFPFFRVDPFSEGGWCEWNKQGVAKINFLVQNDSKSFQVHAVYLNIVVITRST